MEKGGGSSTSIVENPRRRFKPRDLSIVIIFSALGGAVSVPLGYAGNALQSVPFLPFGSGQILSGLHVVWLSLAALMVKRRGVGTMTGVIKGLVELTLFSFHSFLVIPISAFEGVLVDLSLAAMKKPNALGICLMGGVSSAGNVLVLQVLVLPALPPALIAYMYVVSFVSGFLFAGYVVNRVLKVMSILSD
jgi:ABC-type thiamin/hydroxymethylpyrimidine transport system permease subunit